LKDKFKELVTKDDLVEKIVPPSFLKL